jgi:hypothetical protein
MPYSVNISNITLSEQGAIALITHSVTTSQFSVQETVFATYGDQQSQRLNKRPFGWTVYSAIREHLGEGTEMLQLLSTCRITVAFATW